MVKKITTESFLDNLPKDCTTREVIKKIASLDFDKNEAQKRYIENLDAHSAVLKLVTLGYREEARQIAEHCFKNSKANYNLKFAREMAEFLMNHEFKFGSLQEAKRWEQHYLTLNRTINSQIKAMRMFGTVLNNHMMGLTLDREDILSMVTDLEKGMKYDSVWYIYYYYQIKSLLYKGKDLEQMILEAIATFEKRYIRHTNFIVIFKIELINYYKDHMDYDRALEVVQQTIALTNKDTSPYIGIKYTQIELYTEMGNYASALSNYTDVIESSIYNSLPAEQLMKWELLYERIVHESRE